MNFKWENFWQGGLVLFLLAGYALWSGILPIIDSIGQDTWQETSAVVTKARKIITTSNNYRTNVNYLFEYRYTVNNTEYTSTRYSLRYASGDKSTAVEKFKAGDVITVYYNPDNPAAAVVEKGRAGFFVYAVTALGILFLLMGVGLTFFGDISTLITRRF